MGYSTPAGRISLLLVTLACHAATAQQIIPSDVDTIPLQVGPSRSSGPDADSTTDHESGILLPRARARSSGNRSRDAPSSADFCSRCVCAFYWAHLAVPNRPAREAAGNTSVCWTAIKGTPFAAQGLGLITPQASEALQNCSLWATYPRINATLNATARNLTVQATCGDYVRAKQIELEEDSALTAGAESEEVMARLGLDSAAARGTAECPFTAGNITAVELNPVRRTCAVPPSSARGSVFYSNITSYCDGCFCAMATAVQTILMTRASNIAGDATLGLCSLEIEFAFRVYGAISGDTEAIVKTFCGDFLSLADSDKLLERFENC